MEPVCLQVYPRSYLTGVQDTWYWQSTLNFAVKLGSHWFKLISFSYKIGKELIVENTTLSGAFFMPYSLITKTVFHFDLKLSFDTSTRHSRTVLIYTVSQLTRNPPRLHAATARRELLKARNHRHMLFGGFRVTCDTIITADAQNISLQRLSKV
jgi:hypothetical protein